MAGLDLRRSVHRVGLGCLAGLALCGAAAVAQVPPLPPRAPFTADFVAKRPAPEPGPFGYPVLDVDRDGILELLRARRFAELQRQLDGYGRRTRADVRWEDHLISAYSSFAGPERDIGGLLEEWVERMPSSGAAHVARGQFFLARFWETRGTGRASDLGEGQSRAMNAHLRRAASDARAAVSLDPENLAAHALLVRVLLPRGWSDDSEEALDAALERFPASYTIRSLAMVGMQPRWGGSHAIMHRRADAAQAYVAANPRLRVLLGYVLLDEGRVLRGEKQWAEALAKIDEAGEFGMDWVGYLARGDFWYYTGDYVRAVQDLDRAVAFHPDAAVLESRGRALARVARDLAPPERRVELLESAEADLALAVQTGGVDTSLLQWREEVARRKAACAASPTTCFADTRPVTAASADGAVPMEPRGWLWKVVFFVVGIPVTLYAVLMDANRMGLGPAPLVAVAIVAWSFLEWKRQRFWTPAIVHVMAGLAFLLIVGINAAWLSVGGAMWTQRVVVIVICVMVPYVVYLLFLGPRYFGRRRGRRT